MKFTFLLIAYAGAASAQLALFSFDGATETPVGVNYSFGTVSTGSNKDVRFRVHNNGASAVLISTIGVSGAGFSIASVNGILPYAIAPGSFLEFTIRFNGTLAAAYSANLQVNSVSTLLMATAVAPPLVTAVSGCTITSGAFDFGNVAIGTLHLCNFTLFNPTGGSMLISGITLTGGYTFQQNPATPFTLASNTGTAFTVIITPVCGKVSYNGTLAITGQVIPLIAAGITPPLAKPALAFDSQRFLSAEQHTITMSLPSASPCGATGNLNLAFVSNAAGVNDDSAVVFVPGSTRSIQFSVPANSTQVALAGKPSVTFQTGTTAGSLTFTITGTPLAADPTTSISISPTVIGIDSATASNQRTGELDVNVIGFDNTYSAGKMLFAFFDTAGNQVGSPVAADFSSQFKTYFAGQASGSAFQMRVSFPVTGDQSKIGKVQATLTNAAGSVQTASLVFQ
jgi:hypothetical protein